MRVRGVLRVEREAGLTPRLHIVVWGGPPLDILMTPDAAALVQAGAYLMREAMVREAVAHGGMLFEDQINTVPLPATS